MTKVLTNLYLEPEQREKILATGKGIAETIRELIDENLTEEPAIEEALQMAGKMYPGMTKAGLKTRIAQDWLHDRLSGGKRQLISEVKEDTGKIQSEVEELRKEVKALRFMVESLIDKLTT